MSGDTAREILVGYKNKEEWDAVRSLTNLANDWATCPHWLEFRHWTFDELQSAAAPPPLSNKRTNDPTLPPALLHYQELMPRTTPKISDRAADLMKEDVGKIEQADSIMTEINEIRSKIKAVESALGSFVDFETEEERRKYLKGRLTVMPQLKIYIGFTETKLQEKETQLQEKENLLLAQQGKSTCPLFLSV